MADVIYERYAHYTAKFTPRDDGEYPLKDAAKKHIGKTLRLSYIGPIGSDRPRYEGDHEFILEERTETLRDAPVWYSHRDLDDIEEAP